MKDNNKYKNTRVVVFKEDYNPAKRSEPVYKKGSTHAIHKDVLDKILKRGAKVEVKKVDFAELEEKQRAEFAKRKREALAV